MFSILRETRKTIYTKDSFICIKNQIISKTFSNIFPYNMNSQRGAKTLVPKLISLVTKFIKSFYLIDHWARFCINYQFTFNRLNNSISVNTIYLQPFCIEKL